MIEPMTDERLAQIRANATNLWVPGDWNDAAKDVGDLLAEVERLKTEQRGVAATDERPSLYCPACGSVNIKRCDSEHVLCNDCDLLFRESRLILEDR